MWMAIGVLGLLGFIVSVVGTIIMAIKRNGTAKKWMIATGVCFALFIVGVMNDPSEPGVAEAQEAPAVQSQPTTVAAAPADTLSEIEKEYSLAIIGNSLKFGESMSTLGELFQDPRVGETGWSINVGAELANLKNYVEDAEAITAPDRFKETHKTYMAGVADLEWVADNLPRAIDKMDTDTINKCSEKIQSGGAYISKAHESMTAALAQ